VRAAGRGSGGVAGAAGEGALCEEIDAALMADRPPRSTPRRCAVAGPRLPRCRRRGSRRWRPGATRRSPRFADEDARYDQLDRIDEGAAARRDGLLELELALGLPSPADLGKERLAVQVRKLNSRFKAAAGGGSAAEVLLAWCATPGVAQARDRDRCEKIVGSLQRRA